MSQSIRILSTLSFLSFGLILSLLAGSCATESSNTIAVERVTAGAPAGETRPGLTVAIGDFDNKSTYMRGLFSDGTDRLGTQSKTILKTVLAQTGRFAVVDRQNLDALERESNLRGESQKLSGASILMTGEVTEFGRKVTGDKELFGIIGRGKKQTAYAKVSINVVDVSTSEILYSAQGGSEYHLSNREILGTGSTAGYDSTLNGKVLNAAIIETVKAVVEGLDSGAWSPPGESRQ